MLTPTTVTLVSGAGVEVRGDQVVMDGEIRVTLTPGTVALGEFVPLVTATGVNATLRVDPSLRLEVVSGAPQAGRQCEQVVPSGQRRDRSYGVIFEVDASQCDSKSDNTVTIVATVVPVAVCLCVACAVCLVLVGAGGIAYPWVKPMLWPREAPAQAH